MTLPVMISSFARPRPTTAGRREQPPTSGSRPDARLDDARPPRPPPSRAGRRPAPAPSRRRCRRRGSGRSSASASPRAGSTRPQDPAPEGAQRLRVLGQVAQVVEVHPGGEHRALAAQITTTRTASSSAAASAAAPSAAHELAVQRVALLGAVEDEVADGAAILDGDEWHVGSAALDDSDRRGRLVEIKKVGVLGCGLMGHGITQVAATAGYDVVVREVDEATLDKGLGKIEKQLAPRRREGQDGAGGRRRGPRPHPGHARLLRLRRLRPRDRGDHREPRPEARDVARARRHRQARAPCSPPTPRRWRSSTRPRSTSRPERFLGPALLQPRPGDEARRGRARRHDVRRDLRRGPRLRRVDRQARRSRRRTRPGFIVNRLLVPYMLDAMRAYEEGVGSVDGDRRRR